MNSVRPMYIAVIGYIYLPLAFAMLFFTSLVIAWNTDAHTLFDAASSSALIMIIVLSVFCMLDGHSHGGYLVAGLLSWAFFSRWIEGRFSFGLLPVMPAALLILFLQ